LLTCDVLLEKVLFMHRKMIKRLKRKTNDDESDEELEHKAKRQKIIR
jgi:hypothetical protein